MGRTLDLRLVLKCKVIRGARNSVENWVRGLACDLTGSVRSGSFRALMHPVRFAAVGHFGCRWIADLQGAILPATFGDSHGQLEILARRRNTERYSTSRSDHSTVRNGRFRPGALQTAAPTRPAARPRHPSLSRPSERNRRAGRMTFGLSSC